MKKIVSWMSVYFLCCGILSPAVLSAGEQIPSVLPLPADISHDTLIRVAVLRGANDVKLQINSAYQMQNLDSGEIIAEGSVLPLTAISADAQGIRLGERTVALSRVRVSAVNGMLEVSGKMYSESIQIVKGESQKFLVIHEVPVEDYLKGVLPNEVLSNWPMEVLKAQAVASRSYALFERMRNAKQDFDVSNDVLSQVYLGKSQANPRTSQAVDATRGQVVTYDGQLVRAYFHSNSGGYTTGPEYNWNAVPHPVFKGVRSYYSSEGKYFQWEADISKTEIQQRLAAHGYSVGRVSSVAFMNRDASGRANKVVITHAAGQLTLRGNDFRLIVGGTKLRSLKDLKIREQGDVLKISGYGWGHGVGMCQWGAKKMADLGKNYREILQFYFAGTQIQSLSYAAVKEPLSVTQELQQTVSGVGGKVKNLFKRWFE